MNDEEPTIRDQPEDAYEEPKQGEYEPDPARLCSFQFLHRKSNTESNIIECLDLADYRILRFGVKPYLIEDGDASNPKHWKPRTYIEYYCTKHFDQKYRYQLPPTPRITFVKIERP
jgi:hypothetical protein